MFSAQDSRWMAHALRLAEQGLCSTSPNPRVGCVLVADGNIVGSGWHQRAGEAHAEIVALSEAGDAARGATAYVTLEPCSHHGRTPPCADALIAAGVVRVVAAVVDPNPRVADSGSEKLRAAGIVVEVGLMENEAQELNCGFFKRMTCGTPWVRSKIGMSLDGRTALANGVSQWITGVAARQDVQRWRARSCAVLTGIGTILSDDPRLNVRNIESVRQPMRVVLDSQLCTPSNAKILLDTEVGKVLIYTATTNQEKIERLEQAGATVCEMPDNKGQIDLAAMMHDLAKRDCNEVLVEAGGVLNGALLRAGWVDELLLYISPQMLGDKARGMAHLGELTNLDQSMSLKWHDVRQVGDDLRIIARIENV